LQIRFLEALKDGQDDLGVEPLLAEAGPELDRRSLPYRQQPKGGLTS
jgi:hypothetical protein